MIPHRNPERSPTKLLNPSRRVAADNCSHRQRRNVHHRAVAHMGIHRCWHHDTPISVSTIGIQTVSKVGSWYVYSHFPRSVLLANDKDGPGLQRLTDSHQEQLGLATSLLLSSATWCGGGVVIAIAVSIKGMG